MILETVLQPVCYLISFLWEQLPPSIEQDQEFSGAHSVKIYKISTGAMNDYGRTGPTGDNWSRYGKVENLDATTKRMELSNDRSFTFSIDTLDADETGDSLQAATALARQVREVVIPEIDTYVLDVMCNQAGTKPAAMELTANNIFIEIITANTELDNAQVPDTGLWELNGVQYASEREAIKSLQGDYEIIIINDAGKPAEKREVDSIVKASVKIENPGRSKKDSFQGDQHVSQWRNGHKGGKYHNKRV